MNESGEMKGANHDRATRFEWQIVDLPGTIAEFLPTDRPTHQPTADQSMADLTDDRGQNQPRREPAQTDRVQYLPTAAHGHHPNPPHQTNDHEPPDQPDQYEPPELSSQATWQPGQSGPSLSFRTTAPNYQPYSDYASAPYASAPPDLANASAIDRPPGFWTNRPATEPAASLSRQSLAVQLAQQANAQAPGASAAESDAIAIAIDLHQENDRLQTRLWQLEEALEECRRTVQLQQLRTQSQDSLIQQQTQDLVTTCARLEHLTVHLGEVAIEEEDRLAIVNELTGSQGRVAELERTCALLQERCAQQEQALHQAEAAEADLRQRLERQQRQTAQFRAALEQCLESQASHHEGRTAAHPGDVLVEPGDLAPAAPLSQPIAADSSPIGRSPLDLPLTPPVRSTADLQPEQPPEPSPIDHSDARPDSLILPWSGAIEAQAGLAADQPSGADVRWQTIEPGTGRAIAQPNAEISYALTKPPIDAPIDDPSDPSVGDRPSPAHQQDIRPEDILALLDWQLGPVSSDDPDYADRADDFSEDRASDPDPGDRWLTMAAALPPQRPTLLLPLEKPRPAIDVPIGAATAQGQPTDLGEDDSNATQASVHQPPHWPAPTIAPDWARRHRPSLAHVELPHFAPV